MNNIMPGEVASLVSLVDDLDPVLQIKHDLLLTFSTLPERSKQEHKHRLHTFINQKGGMI